MHEYLHQRIGEIGNGKVFDTEFAGQAYATQLHQIGAGKNRLEMLSNQKITAFIPPWNTYDPNTLQVIERRSFDVISGGETGATAPSSLLKFLSVTCDLHNLRESVQAVRRLNFSQSVCCNIHQYDFVEIDKERGKATIPEFEALLRWLRLQGDLRFARRE